MGKEEKDLTEGQSRTVIADSDNTMSWARSPRTERRPFEGARVPETDAMGQPLDQDTGRGDREEG